MLTSHRIWLFRPNRSAATLFVSLFSLAFLDGCGSSHTPPIVPVASSGAITTVVGDGRFGYAGDGGPATAAQLKVPLCVAVDKAGNLYVGDFWTQTIRKVDASTGIISNYAGSSNTGYSGDGGPAVKAAMNAPSACALDSSGNLYIADSGNNVIRKVTASTGIISTVAGNGTMFEGAGGFSGDGGPATQAELSAPFGIVVDSAGNLFISDLLNQRVREVRASTGIINTIAGNGVFSLTGMAGPATSSSLGNPESLALDKSGNLYIDEVGASVVAKLDLTSGKLSIVAGGGDSVNSPNNGDGGSAVGATLAIPTAVAIDSAGDLYISDAGSARVRKVTVSTGTISTVAGTTAGYAGDGGPAEKAKLNTPMGLSFDSSGDLYIVDRNNAVVRKVIH